MTTQRYRQCFALTLALLATLTQSCVQTEKKIAEQLLALKSAHQQWLDEAANQYLSLRDQGKHDEASALAFHVREIDDRLRTLEIEAATAFLAYVRTKRDEDKATVLAKIAQIAAILQSLRRTP